MFRVLAYLVVGWLFIAAVPGLARVLEFTIMLPSTTAVIITHVAFSREEHSTPVGLALAIVLGYLEDVHQGAPVGTLALAHGICFLVMRWFAARIALRGILTRSVAALSAVVVIDLSTWAILFTLADSFGMGRDALNHALWQTRWHALATFLCAQPVWLVMDAVLRVTRIDRRPVDVLTRRSKP
jgi:cell shape-determining protein MreD